MYLLKFLFNSNLVTCRVFFSFLFFFSFFFFEKDVEKVGTPQKVYKENHLHVIFYTKTKRNKKKLYIYIMWPLLSLSLEVIEK